MLRRYTVILSLTLLLVPVFVFAAPQNFQDLVYLVVSFINTAVEVVIAFAVLGFMWGVFQYIYTDHASKIEEGRKMMVWGIIALFVMVSLWGILRILTDTFLNSGSSIDSGTINTPSITI